MASPSALLSTLLLLLASTISAQDTLVYRNGRTIIGQVEEIGPDRVRYRTFSGTNSVVVVTERDDLVRVVLHGGQEYTFNPLQAIGADEFLARRNVISLDILAPALDHVTIGYERAINANMALRIRLGYIGLWRSEIASERILSSGWLLRMGPRFKLPSSTKKYSSARDTHSLAGWYMNPELLFSYHADPRVQYAYIGPWDNRPYNTTYTYRSSAAINLTLGRQLFLGERYTFDIHGGLGYGIRWVNGVAAIPNTQSFNGEDGYKYSHAFLGNNTPLCASGGITFGYAFK